MKVAFTKLYLDKNGKRVYDPRSLGTTLFKMYSEELTLSNVKDYLLGKFHYFIYKDIPTFIRLKLLFYSMWRSKELHTCGRREYDPFGVFKYGSSSQKNVDKWYYDLSEKREYRICSYCGGMHPEDAINSIKYGAEISTTDKRYKVYLKPRNSRDYKVYFQDFNEDQYKRFWQEAIDFQAVDTWRNNPNVV